MLISATCVEIHVLNVRTQTVYVIKDIISLFLIFLVRYKRILYVVINKSQNWIPTNK